MPIHIVKETIELDTITLDSDGNAFLQKRINLQTRMQHNLIQTDLFEDAYFAPDGQDVRIEFAVSPYPVIPTDMPFAQTAIGYRNRYPSGGDDSILFKANGTVGDLGPSTIQQFPSEQIAAGQFQRFYSDHIFINVHVMGQPNFELQNFAWSFMFTLMDTKVPLLTHSLGVLAESHNAMCALVMSNGHMVAKQTLRGNTFPMWRYGGIRSEHMITPIATNAFFLEINTRDAEAMSNTAQIRQTVADARSMSAFDAAFGDRRPDWLRMNLNGGIITGAIRDQWPPIKHTDSGNVRML